MRPTRFAEMLTDVLASSGEPHLKDVSRADGALGKPCVVDVAFLSGAHVLLQLVSSAPPGGDDQSQPETIVEREPLAPVDAAPLPPGERVRLADVQAWLTALLANAAHPEIADVRPVPPSDSHHAGSITVAFHSGRAAYLMFLQALRPGQSPGAHKEFQPPKEI